jgi:pimeloyl-ACP methyl ester carboxylesterase
VRPPLVELGGEGPVLALAVANGFPPETYLPMLRPLGGAWRAVALPPRALWPGIGDPPEVAGSWESLAEDLVEGLDAHGLRDVVAVGHSFGAVAWLIAATRFPGRVRALALLDPTIFTPRAMEVIATDQDTGGDVRFTMTQLANKRRRAFATREEAFNYWRHRPLFADWPEESLRMYVEAMLRPADEGDGFDLRWPPAWEAWYYRSFYPHTWDDIARLSPALPLMVLKGATTDTFQADAAAHFRSLAPWGDHRDLPGGHLFPQSHPAETGATLCGFLTSVDAAI